MSRSYRPYLIAGALAALAHAAGLDDLAALALAVAGLALYARRRTP